MTSPALATTAANSNDPDRECRLAAALADLVHQINISDFRDGKGHDARQNIAFARAKALAEEFGFTAELLREAMQLHRGEPDAVARHLCRAA